jgi:ankyrin repeat protein
MFNRLRWIINMKKLYICFCLFVIWKSIYSVETEVPQEANEELLMAVVANNLTKDMLNNLIEKGANINIQDDKENTPLHWAVINNNKPTVKLLLNNKDINLDIQDKDGYTPLHFAAENNDKKIVELLLSYGAAPYIKNDNSKEPIDLTNIKKIKALLNDPLKIKLLRLKGSLTRLKPP